MNGRIVHIGCLMLAVAVLPGAARAGEAPGADAAATAAQTIVVTGHYRTAVTTSDTASAGTVDGDLLREMPLLRPGEALETVPGLVVTQHSGDGKANQYFLRGYNLDHGTDFATSVDGVPVNMPTNAHGQGYSDINFLIPELVERIDYRKGPYFAENGDFSAAGSADVRYRDRLKGGLAMLTAGANDYRRLLVADSLALGHGGPVLLAGAEWLREDGPWTTPERLRKTNLLARLSGGDAGNGWSIDGIHYRAHWNATDQVPLELIASGALGRFDALDPSDGGSSGRDIVSAEWHREGQAAFTRIAGWYQHYRLQLWSDFTYFENNRALAPNPALPSDQFSQREARDIVGGRFTQGWRHALLGGESTTELGLQLRHDAIDVALLNTQSRIAFATVSDDHVRETALGGTLRNTTRWAPWLRTVLGLRLDALWLDRVARVLPVNSGHASASLASPKGSLIIGPFGKTEIFLSAGRGFHSNDARGVIGTINPATGAPADPAPALVRAFGKEIGLRSEAVPGLQTSLAVWTLNSASELVYSADAGDTEPNDASRRWGIEWNNHYALGRWLLLDADFAWTHARYAMANANGAPGNLIPNAVSRVMRLGATVHDGERWSVTAEGRYFGDYPLTQDGSLTAPAAFVANLRLAARPWRQLGLSLDVLNLFDRRYYDIAYGQDYQVAPAAAAQPNGITVHPGEPRQLRISLHAGF